jgi:hypothetical protein
MSLLQSFSAIGAVRAGVMRISSRYGLICGTVMICMYLDLQLHRTIPKTTRKIDHWRTGRKTIAEARNNTFLIILLHGLLKSECYSGKAESDIYHFIPRLAITRRE